MPEYEPIQQQKEGHLPNIEISYLELSRLLSIFLSSEKFAELRAGAGCYPQIFDVLLDTQDDEITRILISLAITARIIDDREKGIFSNSKAVCGVLEQDKKIKDLLLREACNKILHAKKIRFDVSKTEAMETFLNPRVYLYGSTQKNSAWKATLDLIPFAKLYLSEVRMIY